MTRTASNDVSTDAALDADVAVVGAGAAGLYLAARLAQDGLRVVVLEARETPTRHSRAIGIHPPGLAALDEIGVAEALLKRGVHVRRGHAFAGDAIRGVRHLGTLDFARTLLGPWPFVLTVPQHVTEAVLEARLAQLAPNALRRGSRVVSWRDDGPAVTVEVAETRATGARGCPSRLRVGLLVACVGARADVAQLMGAAVDGRAYGDVYLMADLPDDATASAGTAFAKVGPDEAAIHLSPDGVVEAFPLPGGGRRWVAKTETLVDPADATVLSERVAERTGVRLDPAGATMVSAFGVQRRLARRLATGRVWLCGDAAHVVAPIGGQGMTLAWLGGRALADAWSDHLAGRASLPAAAARYDADQRARARRATERAAWNLRMGRASRFGAPRAWLVRALLTPPLAGRMARLFTMQA
ncbi:MAG: NAD(P)/FAD-dependent oxidoreductase [Trueperaceae bacterium]|nr:NAD(P)/FAD-dependent oxidoreductase [Trueperaceae bacterium]